MGKLFLHVMILLGKSSCEEKTAMIHFFLWISIEVFQSLSSISASVNFNPVEVGTGKIDEVHAKLRDDQINMYQ